MLTGMYAYKIKKPVKLAFIDASTSERRGKLCEEEVRLNRRVVPELYLDVVPIVQFDSHPRTKPLSCTVPPSTSTFTSGITVVSWKFRYPER